ncbi:MAG: hypothetical protein Q4B85_04505 [Lachnospiraceae bacterium]|nr:hypothetical protein [Lachnospiraceae bacterium]
MKKRIVLICTAAVLAAGLFTGCGKKDTSMTDYDAVAIESDLDISGNWVAPGREFSIEFDGEGSFTEKEKLSKTQGTYQFMDKNASFVIGDRFEEIHYISCVDEKEKAFFTGAVLGDLISGYNETQRLERYYVKQGREEVPAEELLGCWQDVNGKKDAYYCDLREDGTLKTTDWEGTYEITTSEEYGTTLVFHFENYDEEYAAVRYEKYLFLYRVGTSNVFQMEKK